MSGPGGERIEPCVKGRERAQEGDQRSHCGCHTPGTTEALCPKEGTPLAEGLGPVALTTWLHSEQMLARAEGHPLLHGVPVALLTPPQVPAWCPPA